MPYRWPAPRAIEPWWQYRRGAILVIRVRGAMVKKLRILLSASSVHLADVKSKSEDRMEK